LGGRVIAHNATVNASTTPYSSPRGYPSEAHRFTIPGRPVPAVRMTQGTKWSKPAQRSLAYQRMVAQVGVYTIKPLPLPWEYVAAHITIYLKVNKKGQLPGNRGDWDNYGKAICDGLQYGEVFLNDRCITRGIVDVEPCLTEAEERAEVVLTERIARQAGKPTVLL
jgi:crossover junction endodeoxyribonuclease RusA